MKKDDFKLRPFPGIPPGNGRLVFSGIVSGYRTKYIRSLAVQLPLCLLPYSSRLSRSSNERRMIRYSITSLVRGLSALKLTGVTWIFFY